MTSRFVSPRPVMADDICRCQHLRKEHIQDKAACSHLIYFRGKRNACPCLAFRHAYDEVQPFNPPHVTPPRTAERRTDGPTSAKPVQAPTQREKPMETATTSDLRGSLAATPPNAKTWHCPVCDKDMGRKGAGTHISAIHEGKPMGAALWKKRHPGKAWHASRHALANGQPRPSEAAAKPPKRTAAPVMLGHHRVPKARVVARPAAVVPSRRVPGTGNVIIASLKYRVVDRPVTVDRTDREWLALMDALVGTIASGRALTFDVIERTYASGNKHIPLMGRLAHAMRQRGVILHYRRTSPTTVIAWADRRGRKSPRRAQ